MIFYWWIYFMVFFQLIEKLCTYYNRFNFAQQNSFCRLYEVTCTVENLWTPKNENFLVFQRWVEYFKENEKQTWKININHKKIWNGEQCWWIRETFSIYRKWLNKDSIQPAAEIVDSFDPIEFHLRCFRRERMKKQSTVERPLQSH